MHPDNAAQQQRNAEVVARGGGSWQARYCDNECPICNGDHKERDHREKENCKHFYEDQCRLNGDEELCEFYEDCEDYEGGER